MSLKPSSSIWYVLFSSEEKYFGALLLFDTKKAVEILACGSCSHSIPHSPKLPLVFHGEQSENIFSISFRKHRDMKKVNNLFTLIIKM